MYKIKKSHQINPVVEDNFILSLEYQLLVDTISNNGLWYFCE